MHMHTGSTVHGRGAEAWAKVAEAVHAAGGAFMPQLWHAGLMRSPYPAADPKLAMVNHHMKSLGPSGLYMPGLLDPAVTPPDPVAVPEPMTTVAHEACIAPYAMAARTDVVLGSSGNNTQCAHAPLTDDSPLPIPQL